MELWPSPVNIRYEQSVVKMIKRGYSIQEKLHIRQIRRLVKIYENTGFTVYEKKHTCRKIRGWLKKATRVSSENDSSTVEVKQVFPECFILTGNRHLYTESETISDIASRLQFAKSFKFCWPEKSFSDLGPTDFILWVCLKNPVCQSASKSHINLKLHI